MIAFIIATASIAVGGYNGERKGQDSVAMTALREIRTWQMNSS